MRDSRKTLLPKTSVRLLALIGLMGLSPVVVMADDNTFFEKQIRPLLIERCGKCHSAAAGKGGLRLDSASNLQRGGESGPVVVPGKPDESLLIQAVRHQSGLKMPPDGKLSDRQIADLVQWVKSGAIWPGGSSTTSPLPVVTPVLQPLHPSDGELAQSLQIWLRASDFDLADNDPVYVWPDRSGHGRDFSATKGVRPDGVGLPGRFVKESRLQRRPAVRFEPSTGMASSPDHPVDIRGNDAYTQILVFNLLPPQSAEPPVESVFSFGNPIPTTGHSGKPSGSILQIRRGEEFALQLSGGFNHVASPGTGSFLNHYGKPIILTVVKQPGPLSATTQFFINGVSVDLAAATSPDGASAIPEIAHRADLGAVLGRAASWCGGMSADVGELILYNQALSDRNRLAVEWQLAEKFGLSLSPVEANRDIAYSPVEKAFWAYQSVKDFPPPVPSKNTMRIRSPIDRFVLAKLEEHGLEPAPAADKLTLLRRVSFDLIGLPPTSAEIDTFLNDDSPQAFETVVNRLLGSPHYGERWGRHWLDLVRFAESTANDANAVMRFAWRYRNYVIDALNQDLPYDQFIIEQLAGDLMPPTDAVALNTRRMVATGYLMVGPKALAEADKEQSRLDIVDDQIDVTGRTFLGLTVGCARCHDHKFDAIRTTDYYALAGIFRSTEPFQNEARNASMWWEFPVTQGAGVDPIIVMAPKEALPKNLRVHLRGNRFTLGQTVPRGFVQILMNSAQPAPEIADHATSGRLELAHWIASKQNPLTARVMVNRIWQHHFGRGIVATSDNFGTRGDRPTHPELLDWLASRFMESGWNIKTMHRLMVLSNTYQQSTQSTLRSQHADPDRRWLSSMPRRRLSAEEIRDAVLAVSGQLDRNFGSDESGEFLNGQAEDIKSLIKPNRVSADDPFYSKFLKRSVYLPMVRNMLPDVLALFDAADPNNVTAVRNETTVPSQSLFLLNSPLIREQASQFATRMLAENVASEDERIRLAHRSAVGRDPSQEEVAEVSSFLTYYLASPVAQARPEAERRLSAWQSYCQILLCGNEFLYVE